MNNARWTWSARFYRLFATFELRVRRWGKTKWEFAVCAVFKNEARYLEEWLEFHHLAGVEHFFLYDDQSIDGFEAILAPWIDAGIVTLRKSKGRKQRSVYNHCLRHGARKSRWIAFIDLDEFLFSPTGQQLGTLMERYSRFPAVFVHWLLFGSNGHVHPPDGGVLDNFTKCIGLDSSIHERFEHSKGDTRAGRVTGRARQGKSIVNPRAIVDLGVHRPWKILWGELVNENFVTNPTNLPPGTPFSCDVIRINHYWSKSIDELTAKVLRGNFSAKGGSLENLPEHLRRESQLNQVEDRLIIEIREIFRRSKENAI